MRVCMIISHLYQMHLSKHQSQLRLPIMAAWCVLLLICGFSRLYIDISNESCDIKPAQNMIKPYLYSWVTEITTNQLPKK